MVLIAIGVVLYVNTHLIPMAMEGIQKAFASGSIRSSAT